MSFTSESQIFAPIDSPVLETIIETTTIATARVYTAAINLFGSLLSQAIRAEGENNHIPVAGGACTDGKYFIQVASGPSANGEVSTEVTRGNANDGEDIDEGGDGEANDDDDDEDENDEREDGGEAGEGHDDSDDDADGDDGDDNDEEEEEEDEADELFARMFPGAAPLCLSGGEDSDDEFADEEWEPCVFDFALFTSSPRVQMAVDAGSVEDPFAEPTAAPPPARSPPSGSVVASSRAGSVDCSPLVDAESSFPSPTIGSDAYCAAAGSDEAVGSLRSGPLEVPLPPVSALAAVGVFEEDIEMVYAPWCSSVHEPMDVYWSKDTCCQMEIDLEDNSVDACPMDLDW